MWKFGSWKEYIDSGRLFGVWPEDQKSGTTVVLPTVHVHVYTGSNILCRSGFRNIYMYELN